MELFRDIKHSAIIFLLHFVRFNFISYFGEIRNIQLLRQILRLTTMPSRERIYLYTLINVPIVQLTIVSEMTLVIRF